MAVKTIMLCSKESFTIGIQQKETKATCIGFMILLEKTKINLFNFITNKQASIFHGFSLQQISKKEKIINQIEIRNRR